jgi:hypothetical protein
MRNNYFAKLVNYMKNVYHIERGLNKLSDGRVNPTYSTGKVILPVLLGFLLRIKSFAMHSISFSRNQQSAQVVLQHCPILSCWQEPLIVLPKIIESRISIYTKLFTYPLNLKPIKQLPSLSHNISQKLSRNRCCKNTSVTDKPTVS